MKIIFLTPCSSAGVAFRYPYYYSRAKFSFANGDGERYSCTCSCGQRTRILNYYWFLCFHNGEWRMEEVVHHSLPRCLVRGERNHQTWLTGDGERQWRMEKKRRKQRREGKKRRRSEGKMDVGEQERGREGKNNKKEPKERRKEGQTERREA